jgi:nucleotide-binding universal stress UspA family protein
MFGRILLCADGSDHARHAAAAAIAIAKRFDSEVVVIHAAAPPPSAVFAIDIDPALNREDLYAASLGIQRHILCEVSQTLESAGVRFRLRDVTGQPVEEIINAAKTEKVDLIVVGSRGLGGFQRLMVGSVSDGVVHHAHCPVLVVR